MSKEKMNYIMLQNMMTGFVPSQKLTADIEWTMMPAPAWHFFYIIEQYHKLSHCKITLTAKDRMLLYNQPFTIEAIYPSGFDNVSSDIIILDDITFSLEPSGVDKTECCGLAYVPEDYHNIKAGIYVKINIQDQLDGPVWHQVANDEPFKDNIVCYWFRVDGDYIKLPDDTITFLCQEIFKRAVNKNVFIV